MLCPAFLIQQKNPLTFIYLVEAVPDQIQGRDDHFITRPNKFTAGSSKRRLTVQKTAGEVGKIRQDENNVAITENTDRSYVQRNNGNAYLNSSVYGGTGISKRVPSCGTKRKIDETLEPIAWLFSEDEQLRLKLDEKLSVLRDILSKKNGLTPAVTSHICECSNSLGTVRDLLAEENNDLCKGHYKHDWSSEEQRQHNLDTRSLSKIYNRQQGGTTESECIRKPCSLSEAAGPNMQMQEDTICMEESVHAVSTNHDALICLGNVNCGDYLKLLELDNDDDERRYRAAMEAPLSPTLPEISSPRVQLYGEDESHYLSEGLMRTSEVVKDDSVSFHTIDVIELEIEANKVKLKTCNNRELLSYNERDFRNSSEELKSSGLFTSCSDFNPNDNLHAIEYNSYLRNTRCVDVEQMHDSTESNDLITSSDPALSIMNLEVPYWQAKPPARCIVDPNTVPDSNTNVYSVSGKIDKNLPSEDATRSFSNSSARSKSLHEDRCAQSCNLEPDIIVLAECFNHGLLDSKSTELMDGENNLAPGEATQASIDVVQESGTITEAANQTPLPTFRKLKYPCEGDDEVGRTPKYCVIFSNTKDEESISRIIHARDALIYQNFMDLADSVIEEVFFSLKLKPNLLPEEKVSAFFSLLVYDFSGTISSNSKSVTSGDILRCSKSFTAKINTVISDGKTGWLFQENFWLDILLNLIEDFIIGRKVLIYDDVQSEKLYPYVSSFRAATVDQLVAASIILACICSAVNDIGFLLEASYKILRMCRCDTSWVLLALHVFASVIGKNLFSLNNYSVLIAAIRSVVLLLERGHQSLPLAYDMGPCFPPCEQCPFYENAISVDRFTSLLLDVLYDFSRGVRHLSSADRVVACVERDEENTDHKYEYVGLNIVCDSSCMLFKYRNSSDQSNYALEQSFCHYTDIVSLVELVGCYMSWEWTSNNVMPRLLVMLESCVSEEFSATLLVLVGQLARFGIDAGGYQQTGVTELRCSLSTFLNTFITEKGSFPTQFAVVGALLNLLPLSFGEIVDGYAEHSASASQSHHTELIKKWFSQLSGELQSLSLGLFRSTDVYRF